MNYSPRDRASSQAESKPQTATPSSARLDSRSLLGGHNEGEIDHEGATYRLRRTRQGKLILTK